MSPIVLGSVLAIVVPTAFLTWRVFGTDRSIQRTIKQNLGLLSVTQKNPVRSAPEAVTHLSRRLVPSSYARWLDSRLACAGRPKAWPLDRIISMKPMLALAGIAIGTLLLLRSPGLPMAGFTIALAVVCYFVPDILLGSAANKRREHMQLALPNMLDQMLISVEAGVGFESALAKSAENSCGPLADEFVRTLQDIQVGRSRREAYLDLAERAGFPELRSFIRAVVQADQYGIAIANVLRTQAKEMRIKRRQRAEEHAMKIPVKILFPLVFAILPALFIIVIGPAAMSIVKVFS